MQINQEQKEPHAIQSYSDEGIQVKNHLYNNSLIISREQIITNWPIQTIKDLCEKKLQPLLDLKPEVIIIGFSDTCPPPPIEIYQTLSPLQIGLECMSIGAACRTFNILLSEYRAVVAGFIL